MVYYGLNAHETSRRQKKMSSPRKRRPRPCVEYSTDISEPNRKPLIIELPSFLYICDTFIDYTGVNILPAVPLTQLSVKYSQASV